MSIPINISGTIIEFPSSGQDPNWSNAVIQFAEAVAAALSIVAGPFDVAPQIYTMTSNVNTNVNIPNLAFPTSNVRGAFIRYTVFRQTTTDTVSEAGNIIIVYNPANPVSQKWEIVRDYDEDALMTFTITDTGQVQFSSALLAGANHVGTITFAAQALLNA